MIYQECYNALPAFLEETCEMMERNAVNATVSAWREQIYHEDFSPDIDLEVPFNGIKQLTSIISSMGEYVNALIERFRKISPADKERIEHLPSNKIRWRNEKELTNFKFQYLDSFVTGIKKDCMDIASGQNPETYATKYAEAQTISNLKRNVVKTSVPYYMTPKDLVSIPVEENCEFTVDTLCSTYMPFLLEFYNIRLKGHGRGEDYTESPFERVTEKIILQIKTTSKDVAVYKEIVLKSVDEANAPFINKLFYAIDCDLLQIYQYIIAVYMRTLTSYIFDVREIMHMVSLMDAKTGIDSVVTESVTEIMDTCNMDKSYLIVKAAENLMQSLKDHHFVNVELRGFENGTFDLYTYQFPIRSMKTLDERLRKLIISCKNDPDSPFQELIDDADLTTSTIKVIFSHAERAENVNFIKTVSYDPRFIYQDLALMVHYIPSIANATHEMRDNIIPRYVHALETNVNQVFPNTERNKEVIDHLNEIIGLVEEYEKELVQAYLRRIRILASFVKDKTNLNVSEPLGVDSDPYFSDVYATSFKLITEDFDAVEAVNERYRMEWAENMTGSVFFEKGGNRNRNKNKANNNSNNGGNSNNTNNNGNNNNDNNNNGGNNNNSNNNGNDQNNNENNSDNNEKDNKKKGTAGIKKFINDIIDKFNNWLNDGAKDKKNEFLSKNEETIKNKNYSNFMIPFPPFMLKNFDPLNNVDKVINNIKSIDQNTLKTASEDFLMEKVFSGIELPNDPNMSLNDKLIHAFEFGDRKNTSDKQVGGQNLHDMVPSMLFWYSAYVDKFVPGLNEVKDTKLNAIDNILNTEGSDDKNDRTDENVNLLGKWVQSTISAANSAAKTVFGRCSEALSIIVNGENGGNNNNSNGNNNENNNNGNGNNGGSNNNTNNNGNSNNGNS